VGMVLGAESGVGVSSTSGKLCDLGLCNSSLLWSSVSSSGIHGAWPEKFPALAVGEQ
jgi:hypothetical protein